MPRRLFSAAVPLLLFVLWICCCGCGAVHAEGSERKEVQLPQSVGLFVPQKTQVEVDGGRRSKDSFSAPSLASAGGVLVAFAEGHIDYTDPNNHLVGYTYSDIVAGYIDAAGSWASLVAEINSSNWKAHTVFARTSQLNHVGRAFYPTTVAKDNKVFLLVGSYDLAYNTTELYWQGGDWSLELLVGEATQGKQIQWGQPQQLLPQVALSALHRDLEGFFWCWWLRRCDGEWRACVSCGGKAEERVLPCLHDHLFKGRGPTLGAPEGDAPLRSALHPSLPSGRRGSCS
ncbi:group II trans-sialidase superfamily [Trypanosoma conorhini]|uniref:Group II trans-sialidase superfamily n=1 Tax=Trypanosoma conorhini TaxID=83891 RepID=A0A3R7MBY2_9TRYP|nr:group II trans-sialidase superfamily [Trypanosoma conorhini]RNE99771.1 group II trans-sialidase superfamily [Trypanosoma conorhini]